MKLARPGERERERERENEKENSGKQNKAIVRPITCHAHNAGQTMK